MVTEILETARLKSEHGQLNREKTDLVKLIHGSCLALKDMLRGFVLKVLRKRAKLSLAQTVFKNLLANALNVQMRKMLRSELA